MPNRTVERLLSRLLPWLALVLLQGFVVGADAAFRVALVGDSDDPRVAGVMATVERQLADACDTPCGAPTELQRFAPGDAAWSTPAARWDLVVAIGSRAARVVAQSPRDLPRLYSFLPQAAWAELEACCIDRHRQYGVLFIDQPIARQLELVRQLVPSATRIGVLLGPVSSRYRTQLESAAAERGIALEVARVQSSADVGTRLRQLVDVADTLLALPDPDIYNSNSIYAVLLTTYSARVPVVGFSEALTKAGAAAAVFASPADAGTEISTIIQEYRVTGALASPGYGERYSISVNQDVLRSLRLQLVPASELRDRLKSHSP